MTKTVVHVNGRTGVISRILTLLYENGHFEWPTLDQEKPHVWSPEILLDIIEEWQDYESRNHSRQSEYPGQYEFNILIPNELLDEVMMIKLGVARD